MNKLPNRIGWILVLLTLLLPLAGPAQTANAQGYVVGEWESPTYGFSVTYRTDAFWQESESSENGVDVLLLKSAAGAFSIEAMPATMTADQCAQAVVDAVYASAGNHELQQPIAGGVGLIRSTVVDAQGNYSDATRRIDCGVSANGEYLVRFIHLAATDQYGFYEIAARDIRASYRAGYSANNPVQTNTTDPDGTLEVATMPLGYAITPPTELDPLYQPTILLTVEFAFTSVSQTNTLLETDRIIIAGLGPSVSHVWINNGTLFYDDDITVVPNSGLVGHLVFAVPASTTSVTFCYQHVTDADCTALLEYEIGGIYGGGPSSLPRINPGR